LFLFLLPFAFPLLPRLSEFSLNPHDSHTVSLTTDDAFFLNDFDSTALQFIQSPALKSEINLTPGGAYVFRGESLTVRSLSTTTQSVSLWLVPKELCPYNNFVLIPRRFSLVLSVDQFSQFCLFSPLNMTDAMFQFQAQKRGITIFASNGQDVRDVEDRVTVNVQRAFMLYRSKTGDEMLNFKLEINAVGQERCEVRKVVETGESENSGKWADVKAECESLEEPAFSLPLACVGSTVIAGLIAAAFESMGWIDLRKLLGPGEEVAVPAIPPMMQREEEHLDVRESETAEQQNPEQNQRTQA
jgi:hypothetical protein